MIPCTPSQSRTAVLLRELLAKVRQLKRNLDSFRAIAGDMPAPAPVFAELFIRERMGDHYLVSFASSPWSYYDIQESFDGVTWFPCATNVAVAPDFTYWGSPDYTEAEHPVFFRVIRRAAERVVCCGNAETPPARLSSHLLGVCAPYGSTNCGSEFPLCSDPIANLV